jgi:hypothetical protein
VLFLVTAALIGVGVLLSKHDPSEGKKYYGLLIGSTILCLAFLAVIVIFIQSNLMLKEITLTKVYDFAEWMRNNSSNSDDEYPQVNLK